VSPVDAPCELQAGATYHEATSIPEGNLQAGRIRPGVPDTQGLRGLHAGLAGAGRRSGCEPHSPPYGGNPGGGRAHRDPDHPTAQPYGVTDRDSGNTHGESHAGSHPN
jgi:hypothetical protein